MPKLQMSVLTVRCIFVAACVRRRNYWKIYCESTITGSHWV